MSDAVNLIALAKMAVIVIGIFMVPIITRKFAADLGAPVGQMAMNRAAIAGAGLGLTGAKIAWAATQGARSSVAASVLTPIGSKIKSVGSHLQKTSEQVTEAGTTASSHSASKIAGKSLEKFGQYLEDASVRHEAKKAGISPPSLADKVKQTLSADPQVTGPIVAKEQRYQAFLNSRSGQLASSAMGGHPIARNQHRSSFRSPASILPSSGSRFTSKPSTSNLTRADSRAEINRAEINRSNTNNPTLISHPTLATRVQQIRHRWRDGKRINKLFESPNERKPS